VSRVDARLLKDMLQTMCLKVKGIITAFRRTPAPRVADYFTPTVLYSSD
jgi:hypothetical protein